MNTRKSKNRSSGNEIFQADVIHNSFSWITSLDLYKEVILLK